MKKGDLATALAGLDRLRGCTEMRPASACGSPFIGLLALEDVFEPSHGRPLHDHEPPLFVERAGIAPRGAGVLENRRVPRRATVVRLFNNGTDTLEVGKMQVLGHKELLSSVRDAFRSACCI